MSEPESEPERPSTAVPSAVGDAKPGAGDGGELAMVLGGGGARGAYQVGLLRFLAKHRPDLRLPILVGVSAGAINAAHLAALPGRFTERVERITRLWSELTVDQVFRVDSPGLGRKVLRWALELSVLGGRERRPRAGGLLDTSPLRELLQHTLGGRDGELAGIDVNIAADRLRAIAIMTTHYATGRTVTWCQGRRIREWERPQRVSRLTTLRVEHVLASAALPGIFPAVRVGDGWYGDGGIRLHAPLAPAVHLGARRIVAVSTRYARTAEEAARPVVEGYPPPAQVLGVILNAIFLDLLEQDGHQLERINRLLRFVPPEHRGGLREVDLLVLRPSTDLGALANDYEPQLPGFFRYLTRRLGTKRARSQDLLSLVMFQPDYIRALIRLGEEDAEARGSEVLAFFDAAEAEYARDA